MQRVHLTKSGQQQQQQRIRRSDADEEEDVGLCLDQIIRLFPNNLD
jgi:hypothetical protein